MTLGRQGFVVYCGAARVHLGYVLMQKGKVITHASIHFTVHEINFPTHDVELATIIFALELWRHYLYGDHVDVLNDQKSVQYVFTQKELNLKQRRWLELLKDDDMIIHCHPFIATHITQMLLFIT